MITIIHLSRSKSYCFQTDKDGKWGLIGIDGKVLFQNEFDSKMELSYAVNGVFRVWDNDMNRFYITLQPMNRS